MHCFVLAALSRLPDPPLLETACSRDRSSGSGGGNLASGAAATRCLAAGLDAPHVDRAERPRLAQCRQRSQRQPERPVPAPRRGPAAAQGLQPQRPQRAGQTQRHAQARERGRAQVGRVVQLHRPGQPELAKRAASHPPARLRTRSSRCWTSWAYSASRAAARWASPNRPRP